MDRIKLKQNIIDKWDKEFPFMRTNFTKEAKEDLANVTIEFIAHDLAQIAEEGREVIAEGVITTDEPRIGTFFDDNIHNGLYIGGVKTKTIYSDIENEIANNIGKPVKLTLEVQE